MNKLLLGGVAALALTAAAGVANAQAISTGYVGASYTSINTNAGDLDLILAQGTASFDLADTFEVQVDGEFGKLDADGSGESSATIFGGTAHAFYDTDNLKVGVFAGYEDLDDDASATGYGVEGRFALNDNISLGAAIGFGQVDLFNSGGLPDVDLTAYRIEASYFASDNMRLDVSYTNTEAEFGPASGDTSVFSVGGEYQLMDNPFSFIASYSSIDGDLSDYSSSFTVGVRRTFGGTLKDRDRTSSPFLGLPFQFGGVAGVLSAEANALGDLLLCLNEYDYDTTESSDEYCSQSTAEEYYDFVNDLDSDAEDELYCFYYGEYCYDN